MQNPDAKPQGRPQHGNVGYEKRDANAKCLFGVVLFLALSLLATHFALLGVLRHLDKTPTSSDRWSGGKLPPAASEQPPPPRLQVTPAAELKDFRAREERELATYGWVNKTAGIVRVPIERAMEMVLQRGLPTRSGTNGGALGPSVYDLQQQRPRQAGPEVQP